MVKFIFHFRDNTKMEIIKRHDLLEAYLQAGQLKQAEACAPKRLIYFYYALGMHNNKIGRSRHSPFRILLRLIKFLTLLLLPMVLANEEELLLNEVGTTSQPFIELMKANDPPM